MIYNIEINKEQYRGVKYIDINTKKKRKQRKITSKIRNINKRR